MLEKVKTWWAELPAERKRIALLAVILVTLFFVAPLMKKEKTPLKKTETKAELSVVVPQRKDDGLAALRTRVDTTKSELVKVRNENARMKQTLDDLLQGKKEAESREVSELRAQVTALQDEVRVQQSMFATGQSTGSQVLPELPPPVVAPKEQVEVVRPKIVVHGDGETSSIDGGEIDPVKGASGSTPPQQAKSKSGTRTNTDAGEAQILGDKGNAAEISKKSLQFIPAGTILQGVLLNGVDAPTSAMAQKNPVPVLVRIKLDAILPNRVTQDLRECFLIMSGNGIMSSERVRLRTESISCVRLDGGVVEAKLDGYAVDEDGKEGMRGRLVTKQGALLARGLAAGFLSGFGQLMMPTQGSTLSLNSSSQNYLTPDVGMATQAGAMRGVSQAANDYAKFYLETAREMYPVVELESATPVTVILVRGASLALGTGKGNQSKWSNGWFGR